MLQTLSKNMKSTGGPRLFPERGWFQKKTKHQPEKLFHLEERFTSRRGLACAGTRSKRTRFPKVRLSSSRGKSSEEAATLQTKSFWKKSCWSERKLQEKKQEKPRFFFLKRKLGVFRVFLFFLPLLFFSINSPVVHFSLPRLRRWSKGSGGCFPSGFFSIS